MNLKIYGKYINHPLIAASLNNLGLIYDLMNNYKLSLDYHLKCYEMLQNISGFNKNNT